MHIQYYHRRKNYQFYALEETSKQVTDILEDNNLDSSAEWWCPSFITTHGHLSNEKWNSGNNNKQQAIGAASNADSHVPA